MDIIAQILLNSTILLYGILLLLPFLSKMNPLLFVSVSWFTGWGIAGVADVFMVIAGVSVTLTKIVLVLFFVLVILYTCCKYQGFAFSREFKKYLVLAGSFFCFVIIFCLLAGFANYMHYSTDSITNEGLSRIFHNYGVFADGSSRVYYWLFNVRLPFYIAVNNIAYLAGIKVFYSFLTSTTIMMTLMIVGFWAEYKKQIGFYTFLWFFICLGLFITNKLIIFHSFYSLSNLTNMAYYSAGILCLNYFRKKHEPFWLAIACLFLAITCIIRKEMLIFSLLPYLFVFKDLKPDVKILFACFAVYMITAYSWFFWGMFYLKDCIEVFGNTMKTAGHGSAGLAGLCFFASTIVFFVFPKIINSKNIRLLYIAPVAVIMIAPGFYYFGNELFESSRNLLILMFTDKGQWSWFWWVFVLFSVSIIVAGFYSKKNIKNYNCSFDWFLPSIILSFFILRIVLYAVFTSPRDDGWNTSGNRMLMHIMPVCVFWMGQVVKDRIELVRIPDNDA